MADFDNPFDAAVAMADEVILCHMGITAVITSGQLEGKTLRVFLMILKKFRSLPEEYGLKILHRLCL
ncbi:putative head-tail joining [Escherichia coli]|uniref:Putative head-tail joining n=1 Tax=Escherichia coli TaxID=562 RepID=A0A376KVN2_ECOLX|nr:putative head-tail joining [Escherichia coli]